MHLPRRQLLVYLAVGIVVLAVGARFLFSQGGSQAEAGVNLVSASPTALAGGLQADTSPAPSPSATSSSAASEVVVDVVGAVARPGVYHLDASARVCDAVDLAGGATGKANLAGINMAAKLVDGQQILVPVREESGGQTQTPAAGGSSAGGSTTATTGSGSALVNLNTATLEELDALQGVGPSTAQKIIDYREANGGFKSVDELNNVSGIGDVRFQALRDFVTI